MIEQPPSEPALWGLRTLGFFAFSAVAGALGFITRAISAGVPLSYGRTVVEALAAGLVGLLAMWICQAMHLNDQWTAVTVGTSGWLGANASIQVLQRFVWKKLGLSDRGDRP